MTREKAEKYIKSKMCYNCGVYLGGGKCSDNCDVIEAIQALLQEPCGNAISRQAVLEYIEGSEADLGHSSENELVCQDIKELPPVTSKSEIIRCSQWTTLEEWKKDFKGFINELSMPKDDYNGIMEYIDEVPNGKGGKE